MMVFHECSEQLYTWMNKQPHVKEESLTDWLLYAVSERCPQIYYQTFSRHEEAENGCDWEWWILTSDQYETWKYNAYRFLVQAKKLYSHNRDNYSLLTYGNRNGAQIDLLMQEAMRRNALPLYMYYSVEKSEINEQIRNNSWLDEETLRWCETCVNGGYLSPAQEVYKMLYNVPRHKLSAVELLNHAVKLSLVDLIFKNNSEQIMSYFNQMIIEKYSKYYMQKTQNEGKYWNIDKAAGVAGIKHSGSGIPDYLRVFLQGQGEKKDWFEKEMEIPHIGGMGIIDLR